MATGAQSTTEEPWTVRRILDWTIAFLKERGSETPRLDAEILLAQARACQRIQLYTQFDEPLTESQRRVMRDLVKRRGAHEPVAYLVGHREFFSLRFAVRPGLFIPRPDTETLVLQALEVIKSNPRAHVLELCTGSGCIAVAIARNAPQCRITTVELSELAYEVALSNIEAHQVADRVILLQGDLFEAVPEDARFDLIVSNPPYIPTHEITELQADVRDHEPHLALDGGPDGLDVIRRLVAESPRRLSPGGWLMFELSPEQGDAAVKLLRDGGFEECGAVPDLSGQIRVVRGRKPGTGE